MKILLYILSFVITSMVHAQKENGTIYFKDGTTKKGLVRIKNNHELKFKVDENSEETKIYTSATVEKVQIEGYEMRYYKNTQTLFQAGDRLIYKIIEGKVSLYNDFVETDNGSVLVYYVDKENEELVQIYPGKAFGKSSDRIITAYFEDCPKLIELLDREAFRKFVKMKKGRRSQFRLEEIVKYYNDKCD